MEPQPYDHSRMRISDADRQRVAEVLRDAAGEGRIDLVELGERLEATFGAKTYGELAPILADLPAPRSMDAPGSLPIPRPVSADRHDSTVAVMSGQDRKGAWEIGPVHTAVAVMGGITLDLREAVFAVPEVQVTANSVMGGIDILINPFTRVAVDGVGIMGDFSQLSGRTDPQLDHTSPLVRVRGFALMGAVNVRRKPMPGERRRILRRR